MTVGGWVFLGLSWGGILGLCLFCFRWLLENRGR